MRSLLLAYFRGHPGQAKVAALLWEQGLAVRMGRAWSGNIRLGATAIGHAARVDRRVVEAALARIEDTPALARIYSQLRTVRNVDDDDRLAGSDLPGSKGERVRPPSA